LRFSDREVGGILVIDLGAFTTKATYVSSEKPSKIVEVPTRGFMGYISDLDAIVDTVRDAVREVFKTVPVDGLRSVPAIITVHMNEAAVFKVANHEISITPSSGDGKITEEQIEKLRNELYDKITGNSGKPLFFSVSRYRVIQGGQERDVENPRGLRVEILKGMGVAVILSQELYDNLMDIFHEYNARYSDIGLEPVGIYSSPIYAALGVRNRGIDTHIHLDLGHTSFRVIKLIRGNVYDFYEFPEGGKSLIQRISSTLSITSKDGRKVLEDYLKTGSRNVQVSGKNIDTTIVENILRNAFIKFLQHQDVRRILSGSMERTFTLSASGGLAQYKKIHDYIVDAGFPEPLDIKDIPPNAFVFYGIGEALQTREGRRRARRNGLMRGGLFDSVLAFFKREILGLEEKGG